MALLVTPYNAGMKLGSGFNSYTQQICVDHAVVRDETAIKYPADDTLPGGPASEVAQSVTFKTEVIDKISDLTDALNINGTLTVKASNIANANGTGSFVNSNKIKTSDLNFLITVKVVNQTVMEENLTKFMPLPNLKPENFTDVYGDCFISGFQVGGEFNALISIKVRDQTQLDEISAKASLSFTTPSFTDKSTTSGTSGTAQGAGDGSDGSALNISADAQVEKNRNDVLSDNEVTISVSWTGGGQGLKSPTSDWNFDTLREAAIKFPELVARTPVRTNAILTKYTALKSFYTSSSQTAPPEPLSYENAGVYTTVLQDAYLDYKNLLKELHLLGLDLDAGKKVMVAVPEDRQLPKPEDIGASSENVPADHSASGSTHTDDSSNTPKTEDDQDSGTVIPAPKAAAQYDKVKPYTINKAYPPTVVGLENAKRDVRIMMGRIVGEVDTVARDPSIAMIEDRQTPFLMPLLFKQFLPSSKIVPITN